MRGLQRRFPSHHLSALKGTLPKPPIGLPTGPQATLASRGRTVPVFVFLLAAEGRRKQDTYSHDEEVQPAPGIGEVTLKAVGHPFEQHLKHKDEREHPVGVLQQGLYRGLLVKVNIFKDLERRKQVDRWPRPTAVGPEERKGSSQPWPQPLGSFGNQLTCIILFSLLWGGSVS